MTLSKVFGALIIAALSSSLFGCNTTTTPFSRIDKNVLTHKHALLRKEQVLRVDYQLSLILDKVSERYSGEMLIDFDLKKDNERPLTVDFEKGTIEQVLINDKVVETHYKRYFLTLAAQHFKAGKNTIKIAFNRPYSTNGTGFHRMKDDDDDRIYLFSDFQTYNANGMFPLFDQPDLKTHFTLDVIAPENWQLISTTRETRVTPLAGLHKSKKHWFFKQTPFISSYVFALHAGDFYQWEDDTGKVPLRLFARKSVAEDIDINDWFPATKKSMAFFDEYFDIDYPFFKYDQIIVPDYNSGAMENVAAVIYNENSYVSKNPLSIAVKDDLADTIAHEMAHMWFGDLVTMQWWNGLWLNESFASFMSVLAMEKGMDMNNAWDTFHANYKKWGYESDQLVTTHPIELPVNDTDVADNIFDGITYGKGAAVVVQLSRYLGAEAFKKGIQTYLKRYSYQNTTLTDFTSVLAQAANKDLTRWTQDWLYNAGVNTIYTELTCEEGEVSKAVVYQTADKAYPTLREHRIQVGFYGLEANKPAQRELFAVSLEGKATEIVEAVGVACPPFAFANVDDWGYLKVDLNAQSLLFLKDHLNEFADPKLRLMLWQSLWNKVMNLTMPVDQFVNLAINLLPNEQENNVLRLANGYLRKANAYLRRLTIKTKQRGSLLLQLEAFAWQQLNKASIEREKQIIGLQLFQAVAHSDFGLSKIEQLLEGKIKPPNDKLSQYERWQLIFLLNQFQFGQYERLTEQELERDTPGPDDYYALIAQRIAPVKAYKKAWLDTIINNPTLLKFDTTRRVMDYIFRSEQRQLYAQFQQRILDALPQLAKTTNTQYLKAFAEHMIDGYCTQKSIDALTKAKELYGYLNPAVANVIAVAVQRDQRCFDIGQNMGE